MGVLSGTSTPGKLQILGFCFGAVVMALACWSAFSSIMWEETPTAAQFIVAVALVAALAMTINPTSRPFGQGMLLGLLIIFVAGVFALFAAS